MEPISETDLPFENLDFESLADLVLRREQFPLRSAAMRMLAEQARQESGRLALLKAGLFAEESSTRRRAAQTLGYCGPAARSVASDLYRAMQTDPMWTVREAAVHAVRAVCLATLGTDRSSEVPGLLLECSLTDREPLVREAAIQGLAVYLADANVTEGDKSVIWDALLAAMRHSHASRRCRAVTELCHFADRNANLLSAIVRGLQDSHWKVRRTAADRLGDNPERILGSEGRQQVLPELIKRLYDRHPVVQRAARETLQLVQIRCDDPRLSGLLKNLIMHSSSLDALQAVLSDVPLREAGETEFRELCRRRLKWHSENLPRANESAGESSALQEVLVEQASSRQKEASWLLARWVEIFLVPDAQGHGQG